MRKTWKQKSSLLLACLTICISFAMYIYSTAYAENGYPTYADNRYPTSFNEGHTPIMTVGADESERNFTWYSDSREQGYFEYTTADDTDFRYARRVEGDTVLNNNTWQYSLTQVNISDLEEDMEYLYRYWNGRGDKSNIYSFTTGRRDAFQFFVLGDPQLGAGSLRADKRGFEKTLYKMNRRDPNVDFVLSVGDQINDFNGSEQEYTSFIEAQGQNKFTYATAIGNHDGYSEAYSEHFALPNENGLGASRAGSNYFYTYNNTLFIVLNSNNLSIAEHQRTIRQAIDYARYKDIKWKVVAFHHSVYSVASHAFDRDVTQLREQLSPILTDMGIDVVFMGHDHVYTRSHLMNGTEPIWPDEPRQRIFENPQGTLYITANSASGSKFYRIQNRRFDYSAFQNQESTPNYSYVEVTDNSFKITTYRTNDDSVVDQVELYRTNNRYEEDNYYLN